MQFDRLTPEQENLIRYVKTLVGANPAYAPLYSIIAGAGSEFLTYDAKKLYIAFEFSANYSGDIAAITSITFYNQGNSAMFASSNMNAIYNSTTTTARYNANDSNFVNIWFSRVSLTNLNWLKFNGIKITWP